MRIETSKWPYNFVESTEFPSSEQRGSLSGQLLVRDGFVPLLTFVFVHDNNNKHLLQVTHVLKLTWFSSLTDSLSTHRCGEIPLMWALLLLGN